MKIENIPIIQEDTNYWLIKTANGKYYQPFIDQKRITLHNGLNIDDMNSIKEQGKDKKIIQMNQFIHAMKVNDIVLIPSHLKKKICIGIIDSILNHQMYHQVHWIKEINYFEMDPKCFPFFYRSETIISLNDVKEYLERLIYTLFIKNEKYHFSLKVNQKSNILFKSIYGLYHLLLEEHMDEHLEVKINLQSPGIIEFISKNLEVILAIIKVVEIISKANIYKQDSQHQKLIEKVYQYEIDKLEIDTPQIEHEDIQ